MLVRSRKRRFFEGILAFALLSAVLAAISTANKFFGSRSAPTVVAAPTFDRTASSRAAQLRMAAANNPAIAAQLRAHGIDPMTGYPQK
jgi:hypothetical protein